MPPSRGYKAVALKAKQYDCLKQTLKKETFEGHLANFKQRLEVREYAVNKTQKGRCQRSTIGAKTKANETLCERIFGRGRTMGMIL